MTKKSREQDDKILILSSGVEVRVLPFPLGLLERINKEHPDPIPPKKTITVLGGTEEVDDESDSAYQETKKNIQGKRSTTIGEAVIEFCIEFDLSKYEGIIKRLERVTSSSYPDDPDERRNQFLKDYALATVGDYRLVMDKSISSAIVTNAEVQERIASFQGDVPGHTANGSSSPGVTEDQRMDVVEPA